MVGSMCFLELHVNTFGGDLKLATLDDLDGLLGAVTGLGLDMLDLIDDVVALEDFAKNYVASVEPAVVLSGSMLLDVSSKQ